jgi:acetoin utilization protein AcuB
VDEARALMQQHRIRHLPVLEDGRLVGIVSDRDIRLVLPSPATSLSVYEIGYLLTRLTVGEIMTYFPVTIGADRLMDEAVKRMLAYKVDALPVVEHGKLIGIVTRTNLLQAFLQAQAALPVAA